MTLNAFGSHVFPFGSDLEAEKKKKKTNEDTSARRGSRISKQGSSRLTGNFLTSFTVASSKNIHLEDLVW